MSWFRKKTLKSYREEIKSSSWSEIKTYTLPEIRMSLNEGDLNKEQYDKLLELIMKVHNKEDYEL